VSNEATPKSKLQHRAALAILCLPLIACIGGDTRLVEQVPSKFWGNFKGDYEYTLYDEDGQVLLQSTGTATAKIEQYGKYKVEWSIPFTDIGWGDHTISGRKINNRGDSDGDYSNLNLGIHFSTQSSNFELSGNNLNISSTGRENTSNRQWEATFRLRYK
jgi:hypothetical protein